MKPQKGKYLILLGALTVPLLHLQHHQNKKIMIDYGNIYFEHKSGLFLSKSEIKELL